MNVDDYRKAFTAEMEHQRQSTPGSPGLMTAHERAAEGPDPLTQAITTFRDSAQPAEARQTALRDIQTATFAGPGFDRYRASFRDALRAVAQDKNESLRTQALEMLAIDKDEVAQQLLLRGLQDPGQALVSTAKAVQLLAHDDHGAAIPVARRIMQGDYDLDTKEEALRALASDPNSTGLLADILANRAQPPRLRSLSASGLRLVDPQRFAQLAQSIVTDDHEDDEVRTNALGALNHLKGFSSHFDSPFKEAVSKIEKSAKSDPLRAAAARFLQARMSNER
jgi:hypothetical protein